MPPPARRDPVDDAAVNQAASIGIRLGSGIRYCWQRSGAIDHRLDAGEAGRPILLPNEPVEVGRHGLDPWKAPAQPRGVANGGADIMPVAEQPTEHARADEAVGAEK